MYKQTYAAPRSRERGLSLVSLMVGIALSLLCIVAAMHAYRTVVVNSRASSLESRGQGVAASTALQLGKILPQAGWGMGIANATPGGVVNTDLVMLSTAAFAAGQMSGNVTPISGSGSAGNALVWATAVQGSTQCYGLVTTETTGLQLLGPKACASASAAVVGAWDKEVTLIPAGVFPAMSFQAAFAPCWPFGGKEPRSSVQVEMQGTPKPMPATCLPNILS